MIALTPSRPPRAFSTIDSRPKFGVALTVPTPTTEVTPSTAGSSRMIAATRFCSRDISSKETEESASVTAAMRPVSSGGRKPLGMVT